MSLSLTPIAEAAVGVIRVAGPVFTVAAVGLLVWQARTRQGRTRLRLASRGLSGERLPLPRRLLAGVLVPLLGVAALCVSLALEQEVRQGPNRMIDQIQHLAGNGPVVWVLQRGTGHFMDDSRLPTPLLVAGIQAGAAPVWEQLAQVGQLGGATDTGLLLAGQGRPGQPSPLDPPVDVTTARCQVVSGRCVLGPDQAVADAGVFPVGAQISVRGHLLQVVAHPRDPFSLINRTVVFVSPEQFKAGTVIAPAYGLVLAGADASYRAAELMTATHTTGAVEVLTGARLKTVNAQFWAGNGTPLLLLLILLTAVFCGVALYAGRRAMQHRERVAIGTLQALGLRPGTVCQIDLLRATIAALVAAVVAWPIAELIVMVTNRGMLGFHASVSLGMAVAAVGLIVAANGQGTLALWWRLRQSSVIDAIGGA